jgi:hypothetical protein
LWPNNANQLCDVAWDLARTAAVVGKGKPSLSAADRSERLQYLHQALLALRDAMAANQGDIAKSQRLVPPEYRSR